MKLSALALVNEPISPQNLDSKVVDKLMRNTSLPVIKRSGNKDVLNLKLPIKKAKINEKISFLQLA